MACEAAKAFLSVISSEKDEEQFCFTRELVDDDLKIKTKHLVEILCFHDMGKEDASKDSIFQIMKIRKGKKLLCRAMPFIPQVKT